jgi:hypothetical protein
VSLFLASKLVLKLLDSFNVLVGFDEDVLVVVLERADQFQERFVILALLLQLLLPDGFILLIFGKGFIPLPLDGFQLLVQVVDFLLL